MDLLEHLPRIVESAEQRTVTALFLRWKKLVLARDVARVLCETIRPEHFASDRADELSVSFVRAAEEPQKSVDGFCWGNCCCHGIKLSAFSVVRSRDHESSCRMCVQFAV